MAQAAAGRTEAAHGLAAAVRNALALCWGVTGTGSLPKKIPKTKHKLIIFLVFVHLHLNAIAAAGRAGGEPGVGAH